MVKADKNLLKYLDGFGVHWYWDFLIGSGVVEEIHNLYPDKFILSTEASVGKLKPLKICLVNVLPKEKHYNFAK